MGAFNLIGDSDILIKMVEIKYKDENDKKYTYSFHRPLQFYFKIFSKHHMAVRRLEEWNSHKKSQKGPKQKAEDKARIEFPMFMMLEVIKLK